MNLLRAGVAEIVGAFALTLGVLFSLILDLPLATPLIAALIVAMFVYTVGPISGAHLNPAVTIALWSVGRITLIPATAYIIAQVVGALLAAWFFTVVAGQPVSSPAPTDLLAGLGEMIGAFMLVFGISAVVNQKVEKSASGLVIGGSLLAGILLASGMSAGVLNPAVSVGLGGASVVYLFAPILGAIAAVWLYRFLVRS